MGKEFLRVKEAADYLGVSEWTLRNWDELGKLKAVRSLGGQRRYPIDYLDKFKGAMKAVDESNALDDIEKDRRIKELEEELRKRNERIGKAIETYREQQKIITDLKNSRTDFCLDLLINTKQLGKTLQSLYTIVASVHNKERADGNYIPDDCTEHCILLVKIVCWIMNHIEEIDDRLCDYIKRYIYNNLRVTNLSNGCFWDDVMRKADIKIEEYEKSKYQIVPYDNSEETIVIAC